MSEFLNKLIKSERIVEWIQPTDERVKMTGLRDAGRFGWFEDRADWPRLATEVKRVVVPVVLASTISVEVDGDPDWQSVFLQIPNVDTWKQLFPVSEQTHIFTHKDMRAWACIALTDTGLGLGVFGQELSVKGPIEGQVQLIPEEIVEKL